MGGLLARAARRLVPSLASELGGVDVTEYPGYACERGGSFVRVSRPALLERLSSAYGCTDPKDQVEFLRGELLHEAVHRERDSKFDEGAQMSLDGLHSMEIPAYLVG